VATFRLVILMSDKLIFISCGQRTEEERSLGVTIKNLIDNTPGFNAYFAQVVHELEALAENIFDALLNCSGLVAILHDRGEVIFSDGISWGHRSSVWINQEIAIVAFLQRVKNIRIPILVFKEVEVNLEGAMTQLIINPIPMGPTEEILARLNEWMNSEHFLPSGEVKDEIFCENWSELSAGSLDAIRALMELGGVDVKRDRVRRRLQQSYGYDKNNASHVVLRATSEFTKTDLVKFKDDIYSGHEFSVNPTWRWHIERALREEK